MVALGDTVRDVTLRSAIAWLPILPLVSACSLVFAPGESQQGIADGGPNADIDAAAVDAAADAGSEVCQSPSPHIDSCDEQNIGGPLLLGMPGTYVLDTDLGTLKHLESDTPIMISTRTVVPNDGVEFLLVKTSRFEISVDSTTLRAEGSLPLVIASTEAMQISGTIDVSSGNDGLCNPRNVGAGGNSPKCESHPATNGTAAGSGGGGGGFGSQGGGSANEFVGGDFFATSFIRGGCSGGTAASTLSTPALGGAGGGAIGLVSQESILLRGQSKLLAGGSGGEGGKLGTIVGAGAGGGSGGMIDISAPIVTIQAGSLVLANGGGGGGGASSSDVGACGRNAGATLAAGGPGGSGTRPGASGGNGAGFNLDATSGAESAESGHGGGGGGVGYVRIHSNMANIETARTTEISPSPSQP